VNGILLAPSLIPWSLTLIKPSRCTKLDTRRTAMTSETRCAALLLDSINEVLDPPEALFLHSDLKS
jgi:hypothetical protein